MRCPRVKTVVISVFSVYLVSIVVAYYLLHTYHRKHDNITRIRRDQLDRHRRSHLRPEQLRIGHPLFESCLHDNNYEELLMKPYHTIGNLHIYSAFLDNRTGIPYVRMITLKKRQHKDHELKLWCYFGEDKKSGLQTAIKATFYEMCENHNFKHGGWIISCMIPNAKQIPCEFFIKETEIADDNNPSIMIPLLKTSSQRREKEKQNSSGKFGLCVPPLYGNIKPRDVIKFLALTNALGIEHVIFYVYNITSSLNSVLQYLEDRGTISIIHWILPIEYNHIWYYGQSIAINDCLYRSMFYFRFLAFTDFDEYIVSHIHKLSLINLLELKSSENKSIAAFRFASAFFIRNPEVKGNDSIFDIMDHIYRTEDLSRIRSKLVVEPYKIFEVGIHHVSRTWPDDKQYITYDVATNESIAHHYRYCTPTIDLRCSSFITDSTLPDWHRYNFEVRYKSRMNELKIALNITEN